MSTGAESFVTAAALLPPGLRAQVMALGDREKSLAEEFRLRVGRPLCVLLPDGEREMSNEPVTPRELGLLLEIATGASVHAVGESLRRGYITARRGHRIGVCGEAVYENGQIRGMREFSSAALRIAREQKGVAAPLLRELYGGGKLCSALIVSPPGGGKTTLLRDIVRSVSDSGLRVSLADERGELAAVSGGVPQLDVGAHTDVMSGVDKAAALIMMLRSMNPRLAALDEVTAEEDLRALMSAANCGLELIATVHARDTAELRARPLCRKLLEMGIFHRAVVINCRGGVRTYTVEEL